MNVNPRFFGFGLAVVLLMGLVGWAGQTAWHRLSQLRKNFGAMQHESFHRAERLETGILSPNETALDEFVEDSQEAVGELQHLLMALVVLALVLGFTATSLIYRGKMGPLRAQLVESRAIIGRQEKLAALGTLAAGVAHEIRNPLTAISVRLHGLKKSLVPESSEHEDATVIGQEIQRLDRIVGDVLLFARPAEPRLVAVTTESLFHRLRGLLGVQLEKAAIRLDVSTSPALWIRVDPDQFDQVLINLVQNAAESIGHDGTITLRARSGLMASGKSPRRGFKAKAGDAAQAVILEVIDTGAGIPKAVQDRLFDPFFTTKETGTGLGLSIAARIIEKHGGALQFETAVDRGTTFGIVLPREETLESEIPGSHPQLGRFIH
ncbi:MAG: ATP-binding protein [Verrucomicrobia bacterium]|nr:ATP-binding protein [Verrucomicrobiota bacterium]